MDVCDYCGNHDYSIGTCYACQRNYCYLCGDTVDCYCDECKAFYGDENEDED